MNDNNTIGLRVFDNYVLQRLTVVAKLVRTDMPGNHKQDNLASFKQPGLLCGHRNGHILSNTGTVFRKTRKLFVIKLMLLAACKVSATERDG